MDAPLKDTQRGPSASGTAVLVASSVLCERHTRVCAHFVWTHAQVRQTIGRCWSAERIVHAPTSGGSRRIISRLLFISSGQTVHARYRCGSAQAGRTCLLISKSGSLGRRLLLLLQWKTDGCDGRCLCLMRQLRKLLLVLLVRPRRSWSRVCSTTARHDRRGSDIGVAAVCTRKPSWTALQPLQPAVKLVHRRCRSSREVGGLASTLRSSVHSQPTVATIVVFVKTLQRTYPAA